MRLGLGVVVFIMIAIKYGIFTKLTSDRLYYIKCYSMPILDDTRTSIDHENVLLLVPYASKTIRNTIAIIKFKKPFLHTLLTYY